MPEYIKDKIIQVDSITKTFKVGNQDIQVLKGISFEILQGDFLIVFGPSGCGKSTLLHIILGLELPTTGEIKFFGENHYAAAKTEDTLSMFRRKHIGMVYQQANWIKSLNVRENVAFPLILLGRVRNEAYTEALKMLKEVEMDAWAEYMPSELSSGQQQRISLARALCNNPEIIVADEPTGNLDYMAGQKMMDILAKLSSDLKKTVIMVTHDLEYLKYSTRIVKMLDGTLVGVYTADQRDEVISSVLLKRGNTDAVAEEPVVPEEKLAEPDVNIKTSKSRKPVTQHA